MRGDPKLYELLNQLNISFEYFEHPAVPTIEEAMKYWKSLDAQHCKNIFFRNHKGNRHYLVILDCNKILEIRDLEQRLKQGKLSFASSERLMKHLGLTAGSVTPFGLINNHKHDVHIFIDTQLQKAEKISFHPNTNMASLSIAFNDFIKFLDWTGNVYEFVQLYE